jgi:hypothetical protein
VETRTTAVRGEQPGQLGLLLATDGTTDTTSLLALVASPLKEPVEKRNSVLLISRTSETQEISNARTSGVSNAKRRFISGARTSGMI